MTDELSGSILILIMTIIISIFSIIFIAPNFNTVSLEQWETCEVLCSDNLREVYANGDCECKINGAVIEVEQ